LKRAEQRGPSPPAPPVGCWPHWPNHLQGTLGTPRGSLSVPGGYWGRSSGGAGGAFPGACWPQRTSHRSREIPGTRPPCPPLCSRSLSSVAQVSATGRGPASPAPERGAVPRGVSLESSIELRAPGGAAGSRNKSGRPRFSLSSPSPHSPSFPLSPSPMETGTACPGPRDDQG